MPSMGIEPMTYRLQSDCSANCSYKGLSWISPQTIKVEYL